jgi:flagellar hook assembly protein FlgD
LPKNIAVEVKDLGNGTSVNARTQAGYNFEAEANTTRTFQVTVDPLSTIRQAISNVTTQVVLHGSSKQMVIGFATTSEGIASLALYQNGQQIATISTDQLVKAGQNSLTWGMLLKNGTSLKPGNYTLSITAVGDGGDTATKYVPLNL